MEILRNLFAEILIINKTCPQKDWNFFHVWRKGTISIKLWTILIIFKYFELCRTIFLVYLGLYRCICRYLGITWAISSYLSNIWLSLAILNNLSLCWLILANQELFWSISGYLWQSLAILGYLGQFRTISDYLLI